MIKAQLNIAATEAVRLNTNNTAHTVDVDVTTLTDKQRHELANNTKFEDGVFIFRSYTHPITADVLPWSQSSVVKLLDISITKREIEASKRADKISKDLEIALAALGRLGGNGTFAGGWLLAGACATGGATLGAP